MTDTYSERQIKEAIKRFIQATDKAQSLDADMRAIDDLLVACRVRQERLNALYRCARVNAVQR